jgi:hypothetical protein
MGDKTWTKVILIALFSFIEAEELEVKLTLIVVDAVNETSLLVLYPLDSNRLPIEHMLYIYIYIKKMQKRSVMIRLEMQKSKGNFIPSFFSR